MKIFIIDTLNVIFKSNDLKNKNKENGVSSFCSILSNYIQKYPSYKIMLIVDGTISNINNYHPLIIFIFLIILDTFKILLSYTSKTRCNMNLAL